MTPYELRFQIFQQAMGLAESEFHASHEIVRQHNEQNERKWDYPSYPSYEYIEKLAEKINTFVSQK
jgi:hypothetical protein